MSCQALYKKRHFNPVMHTLPLILLIKQCMHQVQFIIQIGLKHFSKKIQQIKLSHCLATVLHTAHACSDSGKKNTSFKTKKPPTEPGSVRVPTSPDNPEVKATEVQVSCLFYVAKI